MFRIFIIFIALFCFPVVVAAEGSAPSHPLLQKFEAEGGKVEFLGQAHGTEGWIVTNEKGGVQYVYTLPEGAMVIGMLFAPDGSFETARQVAALKEKGGGGVSSPEPKTKSEKIYAEAEKSAWAAVGDRAAPALYMFMNVTCDHCQRYWKQLEPHVKSGKIQLRLIPYGKVDENRLAGAALLGAADPAKSFSDFMNGDKKALSADRATPDLLAKIDANTKMVDTHVLPGPPFSMYRRPSDGTIAAVIGVPENMMLLVSEFLR